MTEPNDCGLRQHTVKFIRELADWRLFVTLTFNRDVVPKAAHDAVRVYLQGIARECERRHFRVAWGCGRQLSGRLHYHVLAVRLDGAEFTTGAREFRRRWLHGDCQVEPVRVRKKATKYAVEHEGWSTVVVCDRAHPCRRRGSCPPTQDRLTS